jgi:hypothetical protein
MSILKTVNLGLSFLLELCLLATLGYSGFRIGSGIWMQILMGIGIPLCVAALLGVFRSPRSTRGLLGIRGLLFEVVLFGLAVSGLYYIGQPVLATSLGLVFALNKVLVIAWRQEQLDKILFKDKNG